MQATKEQELLFIFFVTSLPCLGSCLILSRCWISLCWVNEWRFPCFCAYFFPTFPLQTGLFKIRDLLSHWFISNSSKPSGWSEMRTDILTTAYDLSSAWYFIFESCHPPSYFLHVSYLWLLSFPRKYNSPSYFRALEYAVPFSWAPSLSISSFTLIALKMIYCLGVRVMIRQVLWTRRKITLIVSSYNSPLLCCNLV